MARERWGAVTGIVQCGAKCDTVTLHDGMGGVAAGDPVGIPSCQARVFAYLESRIFSYPLPCSPTPADGALTAAYGRGRRTRWGRKTPFKYLLANWPPPPQPAMEHGIDCLKDCAAPLSYGELAGLGAIAGLLLFWAWLRRARRPPVVELGFPRGQSSN